MGKCLLEVKRRKPNCRTAHIFRFKIHKKSLRKYIRREKLVIGIKVERAKIE